MKGNKYHSEGCYAMYHDCFVTSLILHNIQYCGSSYFFVCCEMLEFGS